MKPLKPGFGRQATWHIARQDTSSSPPTPAFPTAGQSPSAHPALGLTTTVEQARSRLLAVLPTLAEDSFAGWVQRWLAVLADILGADQLVFYQAEGPDERRLLRAVGGFAAPLSEFSQLIPVGEGIVGQVARSAKPRFFAQDIGLEKSQKFWCRSGLGTLQLRYLLLHPLSHQGRLLGLIEAAARQPIPQDRQALLSELSISLSAALSGALQQQELRQLYQESQAQAQQLADQEAQIRASLEQLQATQQQLIQAEKRASLGQLVAGIAHEINTPIGAIKASAGLLDEQLPRFIPLFYQLIQQTQPSQQDRLMSLVNQAMLPRPQLSTQEERAIRKQLASHFANLGYDNATDWARAVVEAGLTHHLAELQELSTPESFPLLLQVLQMLGNLRLQTDNIGLSADRTDRIVASLRSFAQQDKQHAARPIDLNNSLLRCLEPIQPHFGMPSLKLELDLSPNLPDYFGFEAELEQVWTHLLNNAVHALEGQGKLKVRSYWIAQTQTLHIEIEDSGHGIAKEAQERIFEPFFTTKDAGEGTGLGLHLCRQIVERHGGNITFHSLPGHTVFRVELPMGR